MQVIKNEGFMSLMKGAGANVLRGVAGAGVLAVSTSSRNSTSNGGWPTHKICSHILQDFSIARNRPQMALLKISSELVANRSPSLVWPFAKNRENYRNHLPI